MFTLLKSTFTSFKENPYWFHVPICLIFWGFVSNHCVFGLSIAYLISWTSVISSLGFLFSKPKCPSLLVSLHKAVAPSSWTFYLFFSILLPILLHPSWDVEAKLHMMLRIWAHQFLEWYPVVLSSQVLSVPKDNLSNFSKHAKHSGGFLSATWHPSTHFREKSEVPFSVLSASSEFSSTSALFILFFPRCINSHWTSPVELWSAQFYDVLLEILVIEGIGIDREQRIYYPQSCPLQATGEVAGPSNNLRPERLPLLRPIHWFFSFKKLSSNPMQHNFFNKPLVWNLIKEILKNKKCVMSTWSHLSILLLTTSLNSRSHTTSSK